ncbi:hypothetical protein AVEN_133232-1 [Araneus ventricosus]|uniref:Uncharacterized protein n=1 Tax=Araneus ventricosus TaxID=182803 RepID=A0A4Y2J4N4_ARAVE|nr:hypothetical protein AVEN_133232-1 [Araneus ventricosus]
MALKMALSMSTGILEHSPSMDAFISFPDVTYKTDRIKWVAVQIAGISGAFLQCGFSISFQMSLIKLVDGIKNGVNWYFHSSMDSPDAYL